MGNTQKIMKKFYDNLLDEISNSKEITTEILAKAQLIAKTINELNSIDDMLNDKLVDF